MIKFIFRRLLQILPTLFGIIIITFILFNIVGGSPALMTLGKNVSPKALEEFDEQRGFNKPLFFGNWTHTRAYYDSDFKETAGVWNKIENVQYIAPAEQNSGYIRLSSTNIFQIPIAFQLRTNTLYRLIITYRLEDSRAFVETINGINITNAQARETIGVIEPTDKWDTTTIDFRYSKKTPLLIFQTRQTPLEISSLKLRRKTKSFFDSQFLYYLKQLAHLDFGTSSYTNQKVSAMLKEGIMPSLLLVVPIFLIELIISISISLICAFFRNTLLDKSIVFLSVILMSVNYLVWIVAGQYIFAYKLDWFPIWGFESFSYLLLPICIGIVHGLGHNIRFYRTLMLDEMYQDYVRTAFAKGVSRSGVLFRHVLKNALIPIMTNVIIAIPFLYTGSLLLERFFGIPGLGNMSINALNASDVDVVRAIVLIGAVLYMTANLLTDVLYAFVDPRVKLK
jgi:peptide/nickel transport system permease protein